MNNVHLFSKSSPSSHRIWYIDSILFIFKKYNYFVCHIANAKSKFFFVVKVNVTNKIILMLGIVEQLDAEMVS